MPLYEYRCPHCGSEFERLSSYTQADMVACPVCEHMPSQHRISRVAARTHESGASASGWSSGSSPSGSSGGG